MIIWLLVGYMWIFVHRPMEIWPILASVIPLERSCMICIILVWFFDFSEKRSSPLGNIFTAAVILYTLAITVATLFSPYTNFSVNVCFQNWLKYLVFFVILMTSVKTERDFKIIVTGFAVVCFLFMAHSYREYLLGRVIFMVGTHRLIGVNQSFKDTNDYGTLLVCMLPLIFPLLTLCKKYWHYLFVLGYVLLTLRSVQLTGSRGAFIMLIALAVLPILFSRHRFKILPIMLTALPIGWMCMTEEMHNRYRTIWNPTIDEQANKNKNARVRYFYVGMENWANSPIFGVGPAQHGVASGVGQRAHNLAAEVAGEMGALGVVTFLFLLSCFGINHYNIWKNYKYLQEKNLGKEGLYCWRVSLAIVYAVIMLQFQGLSLHTAYWFHWIWFGAFQVLAAMFMQEKAIAAMQGKLLPSLPVKSVRK